MKVHSVLSVAPLEPAEFADPFDRERSNHPGLAEMEGTAPDGASSGTQPK